MSFKYLVITCFCCFTSPVFAGRSGGYSGTRTHHFPSNPHPHPTQTHTYPHASQTHTYPQAPGLSGNTGSHGFRPTHSNEVHHHYHYSPPQHISYGSSQHPVYQGQPPIYVYQYRDSGSRFDTLLTGLALYNLGRMSANHDNYHNRDYNREYRGNPGEICKLAISKTNGEYEETRIECKLMSSFIWEVDSDKKGVLMDAGTSNVVTKTVTSVQNVTKDGNSSTTVTSTTVVDALQVKGPSIRVESGMTCFMIRVSRDSSQLKRKVDCKLLQEYATRSLQYSGCSQVLSRMLVIISTVITVLCFV
ncbi:unnamed protein product, partial [Brenthis ino]